MAVCKVPLSCEFFPTATPEGAEKLAAVRRELAYLQCEYYSVTYGAGGSTRDRTMNLVARLVAENGPPVMPHLTCVASSEADIRSLLDDYRALGIYRLMALRGDMPSGALENAGFTTAQQLVAYVRELWGNNARIFVAAYPEVHPRAHTPAADLQACGAEIPRWLRKRLEALQDDLPALCDYGADVVAGICERLIAEGVPALHFYSMNRADLIGELCKRLGWC